MWPRHPAAQAAYQQKPPRQTSGFLASRRTGGLSKAIGRSCLLMRASRRTGGLSNRPGWKRNRNDASRRTGGLSIVEALRGRFSSASRRTGGLSRCRREKSPGRRRIPPHRRLIKLLLDAVLSSFCIPPHRRLIKLSTIGRFPFNVHPAAQAAYQT